MTAAATKTTTMAPTTSSNMRSMSPPYVAGTRCSCAGRAGWHGRGWPGRRSRDAGRLSLIR